MNPRVLAALDAELCSTERLPFVSLRGTRRYVPAFEQVRLPTNHTHNGLRQNGVYLITGGLGNMGLAMARDLRVILIKLADRLHNMRTLEAVSPEKRRRVARETLEIYAPIANRLGLNAVFRELQDLCFEATYPTRYAVLKRAVLAARGNRREVLTKIFDASRAALPAAGIEAEVSGREKTLYGIYTKMTEQKKSFSDVLDIYGFRVVVHTLPECYLALGIFAPKLYRPVPGKFKDYIALPKMNGYQSLHTSLVGRLEPRSNFSSAPGR